MHPRIKSKRWQIIPYSAPSINDGGLSQTLLKWLIRQTLKIFIRLHIRLSDFSACALQAVSVFSLSMFQKMLGYIWQYVYTSFLRYWLKWLIRQATGTCELQRICSGYKPGAARTTKAGELNHPKSGLCVYCLVNVFQIILTRLLCPIVEYSLQSSKNKVRKCFHC